MLKCEPAKCCTVKCDTTKCAECCSWQYPNVIRQCTDSICPAHTVNIHLVYCIELDSCLHCECNNDLEWIKYIPIALFWLFWFGFWVFLSCCIECQWRLATSKRSVCPSVRPSVRLSNACLWLNERKLCPHSYTTRKTIYPSFVTRRMAGEGDPFCLKFWVRLTLYVERNSQFSVHIRS